MRMLIGLAMATIVQTYVAGPAAAADNVVPIRGDIFDAAPSAARAPPGPCSAPKAYVDLINSGRYGEIGTLFAEDAVFVAPNGKVLHGRPAIQAFYGAYLSQTRPDIIPLSFIADGRECLMELAFRAPGKGPYRLAAIDHWSINAAGKAERMVVFVRPQQAAALLGSAK